MVVLAFCSLGVANGFEALMSELYLINDMSAKSQLTLRRHVGHPPPQEKAIAENIPVLAAYGASTFNRTVSKRGFQKKGRSMVTGDLVDMVGDVYEEVFGNPGEMEGRGKL